ncbi:Serine O-acetyltransferase [Paenibacillus curdlanolyticus YK9]|uniref:Serine O-acetyltransferase n=1 Tax=Paenibacillus curdlanolyticus YK9 TaxID=717606 RepID=E0ICZ6_9BACL|nr:serine acetyltransferase [Paenibacillus curdlanolyticus]EFM09451.1 Serine O-acetyltransferase [Paenibacillus curdlanolyticus YK9]
MRGVFHGKLNELVANIGNSYRDYPINSSIDPTLLPNRNRIIEVIHLMRELLFPGYFGKQNMHEATMNYQIGETLIKIHEILSDQVCRVLRYENDHQDAAFQEQVKDRTETIVTEFLSRVPALRAVLATDVQAAYDGDPAASNTSEIIFSYPGLFAVGIYRAAHELHSLSVPLIPRIMTEYAHNLTGIDIHAGAKIGHSFFIDHGTGVVIGETTVIGNRVKIYHGVTLGALSTRGGQALNGVKRHPTLEDDVTVYSGASILGGETVIGKGVIIGSNVFISKSVPEGARVTVKNPELIIRGRAPQEFRQEENVDWSI